MLIGAVLLEAPDRNLNGVIWQPAIQERTGALSYPQPSSFARSPGRRIRLPVRSAQDGCHELNTVFGGRVMRRRRSNLQRAGARRDPLRFHRGLRDKGAFGQGFVPRMAEKVADAMGTVQFVLASTTIIVAWVLVNHVTRFLADSWHGLLHGKGFDPPPFILLNLVFSAVAYYSASMVMIAQKTQAKRDQAREEADALHREDLARTQVELIEQNTRLTEDVHRLTTEVHELVCGHTSAGEGTSGAVSPA